MMTVEERAGALLTKKDLSEERHNKSLTSEQVYADFCHNLEHPFLAIIGADAKRYARTGEPFVLHRRITVLTETDDEARALYYNEGDTWRISGNALIWKWLRDTYPGLQTPGMRFGTKGEKLLLENNPDRYQFVRDIYKERIKRKQAEIEEAR